MNGWCGPGVARADRCSTHNADPQSRMGGGKSDFARKTSRDPPLARLAAVGTACSPLDPKQLDSSSAPPEAIAERPTSSCRSSTKSCAGWRGT